MNDNFKKDSLIWEAIELEYKRQTEHIELIASENFPSEEVIRACGTILTNKYAEGYPHARYYGGCEHVDTVEKLAIERLKKIFNAEHANVQPHSGSQANAAAFMALLNPGDKILGMDLNSGGHLTHGYKLNFSGKNYECYTYGVDKSTEKLNYEDILKIALEVKPKLIIAGASAYSQIIDFKKFREICDQVGAYLLVDMAHIAGLIAGGVHPSPVPYADVITSTTHKTLRGPRGGIILCKGIYAKKIDSAVFPGTQGGPLEHIIAAKAIAFNEILNSDWKAYCSAIVSNSQAFANAFIKMGYRVISGSTENHLFMVDVKSNANIKGNEAEKLLHSINITCNKNSIPNDTEKPMVTSGIRLGTAAMTTRGFKEQDFEEVAKIIDCAFKNKDNEKVLAECKQNVLRLLAKYPLAYTKHVY